MRWIACIVVTAVVAAGCVGPDAPGPTGTDAPAGQTSGPSGSPGDGAAACHDAPVRSTSTQAPRPCGCPYQEGCLVPGIDADPDVVFHVLDEYPVNGTLTLNVSRIRGEYAYPEHVMDCRVGIWTDADRQVWLGPCYTDVYTFLEVPAGPAAIGEVPLAECTQGRWGSFSGTCEAWSALPPGEYRLRHTFCAAAQHTDDCNEATARTGASFRIA